jgi:hypothetical protein
MRYFLVDSEVKMKHALIESNRIESNRIEPKV